MQILTGPKRFKLTKTERDRIGGVIELVSVMGMVTPCDGLKAAAATLQTILDSQACGRCAGPDVETT